MMVDYGLVALMYAASNAVISTLACRTLTIVQAVLAYSDDACTDGTGTASVIMPGSWVSMTLNRLGHINAGLYARPLI